MLATHVHHPYQVFRTHACIMLATLHLPHVPSVSPCRACCPLPVMVQIPFSYFPSSPFVIPFVIPFSYFPSSSGHISRTCCHCYQGLFAAFPIWYCIFFIVSCTSAGIPKTTLRIGMVHISFSLCCVLWPVFFSSVPACRTSCRGNRINFLLRIASYCLCVALPTDEYRTLSYTTNFVAPPRTHHKNNTPRTQSGESPVDFLTTY